jgi:hypothetical protein
MHEEKRIFTINSSISLILTLCLAQREGDAIVRREDNKGVIVQVTSLQLRQDEPHTLVHSNKR